MAILNLFKKKKEIEKVVEQPKEVRKETPIVAKRKRKPTFVESHRILRIPHITEKASDLAKKNQYVFRVDSRANKFEIKRTLESIYGVEAISVKIIKVPRKKRRLGRTSGWRKGYKKAIVRLKEGQKIEVLPR